MAGELRRAGRQGDDDLHRRRPPRQLDALRRRRAAAARSSRASARRTSRASRTQQKNALVQDLRDEQRGGARQGAPAGATSSPARPTATRRSARVAGIEAITLDDVKDFVEAAYTRAALTRRPRGRRAGGPRGAARAGARARCPEGPALAGARGRRRRSRSRASRSRSSRRRRARRRSRSATRSRSRARTPTSRRSALARTWLGEHRSSTVAPLPAHPRGARHELRRLRLHRGVPARHVPVLPRPEHRAPRAALRGLDPAGGARERARWRCASRSTSSSSSSTTASPQRTSRRRATT